MSNLVLMGNMGTMGKTGAMGDMLEVSSHDLTWAMAQRSENGSKMVEI